MAAVVKVARTRATVDMGPPLAATTYDRDAIIIDYLLGTTGNFADAASINAAQEIISRDAPDGRPELAHMADRSGLNSTPGQVRGIGDRQRTGGATTRNPITPCDGAHTYFVTAHWADRDGRPQSCSYPYVAIRRGYWCR
jgi:hypothetical protein